jgi:hypothetical protein
MAVLGHRPHMHGCVGPQATHAWLCWATGHTCMAVLGHRSDSGLSSEDSRDDVASAPSARAGGFCLRYIYLFIVTSAQLRSRCDVWLAVKASLQTVHHVLHAASESGC